MCGLVLPPYLGTPIERLTQQDDTCSFYRQAEMEGDMEAIHGHGWGGQG